MDPTEQGALMPWARLEDNYFDHRKVVRLSKDAKLLDLAAIAYSARELCDGILTMHDIRVVAAKVEVDDLPRTLTELQRAERWMYREDGTWAIHDYHVYNPTREKVLSDRDAAKERMKRIRHPDPQPDPTNGRSLEELFADGSPEQDNEQQAHVPSTFNDPGPGPGIRTRSPDPETPAGGSRAQAPAPAREPVPIRPARTVAGEPAPKPTPSPTPVGTFLDAVKALDPELQVNFDRARFGKCLKDNPDADLPLMAEAYVAWRHGEWTGDHRGELHYLLSDMGKYSRWKENGRRRRLANGRESAIDAQDREDLRGGTVIDPDGTIRRVG